MSHWAEIDENNIVIRVAVGDNKADDEGESFFKDVIGGNWIKTSVNTYDGVHYTSEKDKDGKLIPSADQSKAFRGNYAGIGMVYNPDADEFEYVEPEPGPEPEPEPEEKPEVPPDRSLDTDDYIVPDYYK
tara:strand:+ start:92 stop:481 length:390 start_codon:yes stop_codon:yes gene_type:complete